MKITHWPVSDRPREKLLSQGAQSLSDAELLAILLKFGTRGKTALDLARELLQRFGGLLKLKQAQPQHIYDLAGVGKAKYATLLAALELGKRYSDENIQPGEKLTSIQATQRFLAKRLREHTREVFSCIFLNNQQNIIAFEELFMGSIAETNVHPREIVKRGLAHNAAKVILAHNHPSGDPTPSQADQELTRYLIQTLALVDIQVIDHVIIGQQGNFSFAEAGWI